jgi:hypothetical protein
MLVEGFHGVVEIVLAARGEQDSLAREIEQGALQGLIRRAGIFGTDLDSGHAVFADDAAPERVVEIDNQTFGSAACERH